MAIFQQHFDGINRSRLGRREGIGAATVERYFRHGLQRQFSEQHSLRCPPVLGIDEHFFTRKKGFATTLCDPRKHKIYDVVSKIESTTAGRRGLSVPGRPTADGPTGGNAR